MEQFFEKKNSFSPNLRPKIKMYTFLCFSKKKKFRAKYQSENLIFVFEFD